MATNNAANNVTAASGQVLQGQGIGMASTFSTATYPATTTANQLLYSSAANTVAGLTSGNNQLLITNGSGVPAFGIVLNNSFELTTANSLGTELTIVSTSATSTANAMLFLETISTSSGNAYINFEIAGAGGQNWTMGLQNGATVPSTNPFKLSANNNLGTTDVIQCSTSGSVVKPLQPSASVYLNTGVTNVTGDGTYINPVIFDTKLFDQQNNYSTSTGLFTCPVAGIYAVTVTLTFTSLGVLFTSGEIQIRVNGAEDSRKEFNPSGGLFSTDYAVSDSFTYQCAKNDTLSIDAYVGGSTKTVGLKGSSFGYYCYATFQLVC